MRRGEADSRCKFHSCEGSPSSWTQPSISSTSGPSGPAEASRDVPANYVLQSYTYNTRTAISIVFIYSFFPPPLGNKVPLYGCITHALR